MRYRFDHWEDNSTNPVRAITVTQDMTIIATYVLVTRMVGYESTPIPVDGLIDTTPIPSGTTIEIPDGATITISVPSEVEA